MNRLDLCFGGLQVTRREQLASKARLQEERQAEKANAIAEKEKQKEKKSSGKGKGKGKRKRTDKVPDEAVEAEASMEDAALLEMEACGEPLHEVEVGPSKATKARRVLKKPASKAKAKAKAKTKHAEAPEDAPELKAHEIKDNDATKSPKQSTPSPKPKKDHGCKIPATFARRYMPGSPGLARDRWSAIRAAFYTYVMSQVTSPSKHEDL